MDDEPQAQRGREALLMWQESRTEVRSWSPSPGSHQLWGLSSQGILDPTGSLKVLDSHTRGLEGHSKT